MKWIAVLIGMLLLAQSAVAHGIEKGPESKSSGDYVINFSTEPKFPVTGKITHLDLTVKDRDGGLLSDLDMSIELHRLGKSMILDLREEEKGHYSVRYNFNEPGSYGIHPVIDDRELGIEFGLTVDSFGLSGLLRSGVVIALLLVFAGLMYRDCRRR